MKKVLVTGGAGYIGSKLVTKLLELNYRVTVIDSLKFSSKSLNHLFNNNNLIFIKGDVRNKKLMTKLNFYTIKIIFKLYLRTIQFLFYLLNTKVLEMLSLRH